MSDAVRINQSQYSWGSIVVKVDGDRFFGFTSLGYGDKRERVYAHGMGKHQAPRGRSRGKYTPDPVTLGGYKSSMQELRRFLASKAPDGISYGDVEFEITSQYLENDEIPILVEIERCVIVGNTTSEEESADPLKEEIEISCMVIRRNKLVLFDATDEGSP